jgi:hypothetical protein
MPEREEEGYPCCPHCTHEPGKTVHVSPCRICSQTYKDWGKKKEKE